MNIKEMLKEGEIGLSKYKNIIGIGVIVFFLVFGATFIYTFSQEKKIAEDCGFINEKIKCVCTKNAWDEYKLDQLNGDGEYQHLNITTSSNNYNAKENFSPIEERIS